MKPALNREHLAAFVDGELSPEDAAAVVMHLADHSPDQAYVDDLLAANELLAAAFAEPLHEPVPPAIHAAIFGAAAAEPAAVVVPFRPRPKATLWAGAALALAAGIAAMAVLLPGAPPAPGGALLALGPLAPASELATVVATLPSGVPEALSGGQEVMILATMRTGDGRYCREVEVADRSAARLDLAIACTLPDGGWRIEVVMQEPLVTDGDGSGFVTASGPEAQALGVFLDRQGAGPALDPATEQQVIAGGWTP